MKLNKYALALTEVLFVSPALLFMTALFVRNWQPQQYEPAHTAQRIVNWYAHRPHIGLWVLLIALPFAVLATGVPAIWHKWHNEPELRQAAQQTFAALRAHLAAFLIAGAALSAAGILSIVSLHVLTD